MRAKRMTTGSRFGDVLLALVFVMIAGVGVLTTTLLISFDASGAALGDADVPPQRLSRAVVVLGDSLAQGVGASSARRTLSYGLFESAKQTNAVTQLWNFGTAGALTDQVVDEQLPRLAAVEASIVYIIVGANDVTRQTDPEAFRASYRELLAAATSKAPEVYAFTIPKLVDTPAVPQQNKLAADLRTQQLNTIINEEVGRLSARGATIRAFDFYGVSARELTQDSDLLAEDKFHPNDAGYAAVLSAFLKSK